LRRCFLVLNAFSITGLAVVVFKETTSDYVFRRLIIVFFAGKNLPHRDRDGIVLKPPFRRFLEELCLLKGLTNSFLIFFPPSICSTILSIYLINIQFFVFESFFHPLLKQKVIFPPTRKSVHGCKLHHESLSPPPFFNFGIKVSSSNWNPLGAGQNPPAKKCLNPNLPTSDSPRQGISLLSHIALRGYFPFFSLSHGDLLLRSRRRQGPIQAGLSTCPNSIDTKRPYRIAWSLTGVLPHPPPPAVTRTTTTTPYLRCEAHLPSTPVSLFSPFWNTHLESLGTVIPPF